MKLVTFEVGTPVGRFRRVGVVDGTVVATGAFRPPGGFLSAFIDTDPSTAEIKRMHVAPDHQRQGCAQRILDELHQRARDAGYSTFVLTTSNRQSAAMEFYEANGFEEVGREHVELPDESFDMLFYEKSLVPENR
jgi:ribosomal protein S18 acetylase RimI-like enzyme